MIGCLRTTMLLKRQHRSKGMAAWMCDWPSFKKSCIAALAWLSDSGRGREAL
jgi:hypothetical protein